MKLKKLNFELIKLKMNNPTNLSIYARNKSLLLNIIIIFKTEVIE